MPLVKKKYMGVVASYKIHDEQFHLTTHDDGKSSRLLELRKLTLRRPRARGIELLICRRAPRTSELNRESAATSIEKRQQNKTEQDR